MLSTVTDQITELRSRQGMKLFRYGVVSAFNVVLGQVLLYTAQVLFQWQPVAANTFAVSIGALPAYLMSRYWVWGKKGKTSFMREVVPFWSLAFVGYACSTLAIWYVDTNWEPTPILINLTSLAAYGVVWVARFVILDKVLFKPEELPAV